MVPSPAIELATALVAARCTGRPVDPATAAYLPANLAEAYEVQAAAVRLRGAAVAAFKIGLTSAAAQEGLGAVEPIAGRLAPPDIRLSPARIEAGSHLRIVEAEVIFRFDQDLPPEAAPFSKADVMRGIGCAFAGIEVCDTRFMGDDDTLARIVADNGNADLLVVGEPLRDWSEEALRGLTVTLIRRTRPDVRGSTAKVLGHPLEAVTWLANWLAARGEGIHSGQLVASGSCTGMTVLGPDEEVTATFGSLGSVSMRFVQAFGLKEDRV
ncbi:2-keto-4-pentenoate hydratase [Nitrospirillum viridazoti]|uniref:2-oxo-3-hexenedioate decarboxylase/2-keto-4-pentenoate hydratase n=1 Tax=Nitrospirillum amazonense TaxID=28077 RepID=A0A560J1T2_9PROT|nr:hypothetical protein [Nitrospirillum amazonense]TWB64389.1 2-oxo-3-hexenedioate decarboxylase/2-keto-4-pentenoate hydratase [Nitrospirillum amazonense]